MYKRESLLDGGAFDGMGLVARMRKWWYGGVPFGLFCMYVCGLHMSYWLLEHQATVVAPALDPVFETAKNWRLVAMSVSMLLTAVLLVKVPKSLRYVGFTAGVLNVSHTVIACGVQLSAAHLVLLGSILMGVEVGCYLTAGAKLLLTWVDDQRWVVPSFVACTLVFGASTGVFIFQLLSSAMPVASVMHTLGFVLIMLGIAFMDGCRLPVQLFDSSRLSGRIIVHGCDGGNCKQKLPTRTPVPADGRPVQPSVLSCAEPIIKAALKNPNVISQLQNKAMKQHSVRFCLDESSDQEALPVEAV
eukprot:CAMPEP_0198722320 /NCGR_PEP_ID=MMETSP1475-20131203/91_1 /TAXON_ID= ORGANISM="Unidentified sp., Strain CCMP1999" /NCGR_SAMPLE_ID=MMETSP1475 /ASSEMBLY_ACC=CAM_ASM_001111 /LENGTH=301 /DNA_ID=CAMNT_0044483223 /DNA_START=111 /DNA_END=1016 /DNA_ORIENTATION=+